MLSLAGICGEAKIRQQLLKDSATIQFVSADKAADADIDGTPGRGLYDPPAGDKTSVLSLYCEGGVTLVFPQKVGEAAGGALSLDWIAGKMRYQIDRKFARLDGSLSSLELTEIQKTDAENFAPMPKPKFGGHFG